MSDLRNKEVFELINNAVNEALRSKYGPPDKSDDPQLPARAAVALLQLSLLYFAHTQAPKSVIIDFVMKLLNGDEESKGKKAEIKQDGNRLILPGQDRLFSHLRKL